MGEVTRELNRADTRKGYENGNNKNLVRKRPHIRSN